MRRIQQSRQIYSNQSTKQQTVSRRGEEHRQILFMNALKRESEKMRAHEKGVAMRAASKQRFEMQKQQRLILNRKTRLEDMETYKENELRRVQE